MQKALDFYTADVFTTQPFGGNPLAVFPDAQGLSDAQMQTIAREMNLSETVFCFPPEDPAHSRKIRIFTPATELPFAGHPTIGTAILLASTEFADTDRIILEEKVGPVSVAISRAAAGLSALFDSPRAPVTAGEPAPDEDLAKLLSLPPDCLSGLPAKAQIQSAGVPFLFIPVRDADALAAIRVDLAIWHKFFAGGAGQHIYAYTMPDWAGREVNSRMFAPAMGIAEDPATGGAAAALPGALASFQTLPDGETVWQIRQGVEMRRPSELRLEADLLQNCPQRVRVGGSAVILSKGRLFPDGIA